jgi:hypothetical protein
VDRLHAFDPSEAIAFTGEILARLRREVGDEAAVLGFCGAPWTLASYLVEGGGSKSFAAIKEMMGRDAATLRRLLELLAALDHLALRRHRRRVQSADRSLARRDVAPEPIDERGKILAPLPQRRKHDRRLQMTDVRLRRTDQQRSFADRGPQVRRQLDRDEG